jgi:hypothetical protein
MGGSSLSTDETEPHAVWPLFKLIFSVEHIEERAVDRYMFILRCRGNRLRIGADGELPRAGPGR